MADIALNNRISFHVIDTFQICIAVAGTFFAQDNVRNASGLIRKMQSNSAYMVGTVQTAYFRTTIGANMRSILLWLLGVPIPIIILLALFWH